MFYIVQLFCNLILLSYNIFLKNVLYNPIILQLNIIVMER